MPKNVLIVYVVTDRDKSEILSSFSSLIVAAFLQIKTGESSENIPLEEATKII